MDPGKAVKELSDCRGTELNGMRERERLEKESDEKEIGGKDSIFLDMMGDRTTGR